RSSEQYGSAAASIDETKQLRLTRSAEYFLNASKEYANLPMRFDAVLLTRSVHQLPITWIKDAFNA
ncbi:MAG: YraN family protein, partial [Pseudomonadota bacterium]|nr:YraN family protein [Pseudomonadota bacterium]